MDGIVFEIFDRDSDRDYPNIKFVSNSGAFWVDTKPLRENIEEKISRYKVLVIGKGIPLVVGTVADPQTSLNFKNFQDVLLGEREDTLYFENSTNKVVKKRQTRKQNGLFLKTNESLSAAIWVWKDDFGKWSIKAIHNPYAKEKLPCNTFDVD